MFLSENVSGIHILDSRLKFATKPAESVWTNLAAPFGGHAGMTYLCYVLLTAMSIELSTLGSCLTDTAETDFAYGNKRFKVVP